MDRKVRAETKEFGDIIRLDSTDTYADLARKTLKLFSKLPDKFDASFYFKVTTRLRNWGWRDHRGCALLGLAASGMPSRQAGLWSHALCGE